MSLVVSDSGPIHYLIQVDGIDVLGSLFDKVYIPEAVYSELTHAATPVQIKEWVKSPPDWLQVKAAAATSPPVGIERGEQEAICLAEEISADVVLIDDRKARIAAEARGLTVTGTVGILVLAARRDLLNLADAFEKLKQTKFHIRPAFLDAVLRDYSSR